MNVLIILPAQALANVWPLAGSQRSWRARLGDSGNTLPSTSCAAADELRPPSRDWHLSHSVAFTSSDCREHRGNPKKAAVSGPGQTG